MDCDGVADLLVAYQDDELDPLRHQVVRHHLRRCPRCRDHERALRRATPRPAVLHPPEIERALGELSARLVAMTPPDPGPPALRPVPGVGPR